MAFIACRTVELFRLMGAELALGLATSPSCSSQTHQGIRIEHLKCLSLHLVHGTLVGLVLFNLVVTSFGILAIWLFLFLFRRTFFSILLLLLLLDAV